MADQRYRVIERLEAGGMAEVFIGEAVSVQGFKKRVAIKRVLPHLAQNKNFMAMFLDEARLGARLNHANVVTVFDIGAADNTYFIVMEYVDGANLKTIIESVRKQGRRFPLKEAVYICMEACRGLSYAHELTDENGAPLHLVHRDVSPPNIMISKRGEVKVTDFGLAKATTQLEKTDPGVVKGKFSYLSPEAAVGKEVDARADVFALGIVLWEMLAGRRLFLGETDYQTVKLVQQANVPSLRQLNAEVEPDFEKILLKALARDPDERYENAREFGDTLAGYLFGRQMKVTSYDISNLLKTVLVRERKSQPPAEQSIIDRLIQEELLRFTSLEDMSDPLNPGASPLSPDEVEGAKPLDADAFENPAEWFSGEFESFGAEKSEAAAEWREVAAEPPTAGGNLAALLEADETGPVRHQLPVPLASRSNRPIAPPEPPPTSSLAPKPASSGRRILLIGVVVLLLVGAGAAAFFGGIMSN